MADFKKLRDWATALRSGEFEQTDGRLERDGKYCCLGVATVLAHRAGVPDADVHNPWGPLCDPPAVVDQWFDHDISSMELPFGDRTHFPADANDEEGKTFPEIADAIDRWCDERE